MNTLNDSELSILKKSAAQLNHFIKAAHQMRNANLLGGKVAMLADAPAPVDTPDKTSLNDILNNAVKAPGTTSIATVPEEPNTKIYQMLGQVQTLDSYISLLTALSIYHEHPNPYNIKDPAEASAFTQAIAKWRNYVITGGTVKAMAGYLPVGSITTQSYSESVTRADLHFEFLKELFVAFSFPEGAMLQLDSILTKVVNNLNSLKLSFQTQTETLDHFLTYYYFSTLQGTGGNTGIPATYVPKIRTFYLHIDQSSWKASVGKSSVDSVKFNMNYFDMDTTMDPVLVANDMTAINDAIHKLTGKTGDEVNNLMNMQAIHADPQKA